MGCSQSKPALNQVANAKDSDNNKDALGAVSEVAMATAVAVPVPVEAWAKSVFAQFDSNSDGKIDTTELKRAIKSLPVIVPRNAAQAQAMGDDLDELLGRMDSSGDGQLDENEWVENIRACGGLHARIEASIGEDGKVSTGDFEKEIKTKWAKSVFAQFDMNSDGKIDAAELKRAIKSLPIIVPRNAEQAQAMGSDLDELLSRMDSSGDGQLNESEWVENICKCGGLHARIEAAIGADGKVTAFEELEKQVIDAWAKAVFAQFDANSDEKIDAAELKKAIDSLPVIVPRNAEQAQAMGSDLDELLIRMDASGDGQLDLSEWVENIKACGGLYARITAAVGEDGKLKEEFVAKKETAAS
jgi:Ca2+-binding EF-hand superfamily protein